MSAPLPGVFLRTRNEFSMDTRTIKILATDENMETLAALQALIRQAFPEAVVLTTQKGHHALGLVALELPDVILVGSSLQDMDGLELCTRLKADLRLHDIPVVFITSGTGDNDNRLKALERGSEAFLAKPFDLVDLTVQLRAMLKIRAATTQKQDEKKLLAYLVEEKTRTLQQSHANTLQLLEAVKREQALVEAIFDSMPGYLYVYDEKGKLIRWNKKHETMTGYSADELSHMTMDKWFDQDDIAKVNSAVHDVFKKGYAEVEAPLILKNGEKMLVRSSGAPLLWDGKNYFAGIGIDITEQKKMQEALWESQSILKAAFENSQTGIAIADAPSGKLRYVNKAGLLMRNISEKEMAKGIDITSYAERWNMFHLDGTMYAMEEVPLARALLHGETCSEELIIRRDDLENRYVLANATPIKDSEGKIKAGIVVFFDITERKNIEMQFHQNMDDLLGSQRIAHLGTWRMNIATDRIVWSEELYAIFGLDPILPPPLYSEHGKLFTVESWERLSSALKLTKTRGLECELEVEAVTLEGKHKWIWVRGEALRDQENTITSLWGAAQDITERKQNESELLYLSNHDHLTGLHNRRYFEDGLKRLDTRENLPISIIMCDVNGLKLVNDSFGHASGDALLKAAAKIIKNACRGEGIVARMGGDEFVVVLPRTTEDEMVQVANTISVLASKEKVSNIELSISYGYETKTNDAQSIVEVIANAENHMYQHKLYERSSIRSKTIDLIMNTLFEKSNREAMHSSRVSCICQSIASKMDFSKDAANQMRIAGLIHDIGKIGVDETILNKPGRLTPEERTDIERHPEIGWRILSSTIEFSELAQFVLNHHENWDGSGYPNGLKGEEIQLEARIISVADSYDAMTSERSYKKGMKADDAIREMQRCSGTQFDPKIVDVLVNLVLPETSNFRQMDPYSLQ